MHNLAEFLSKSIHWLVFIALEVVCAVLLFRYNGYQGSVWLSSANYMAGAVYDVTSKVEAFFGLSSLNQQLTQRNLYLERQVAQLEEQLYGKRHAAESRQGQIQMLSQYHLIPAKVVDNSINRAENFITIDKGAADGVRKDMGVASGNGVVGIVYLVGEHHSVIISALNDKSNISCALKGRDYFGYLHWSGGASDVAYIDDIPRHAKFALGDTVVTSGYSAVFPRGILVGRVKHVYNSPDGLSYRLQVKLSTDFGRLRDVCLIDDSSMQQIKQIQQAALDSIQPKQ